MISWVAGVAAALAVLAGGAAFIAKHGGPIGFVDQRVKEFRKVGYPDLRSQGIRYGANVGSNRHDFWRVGLDEAVEEPLLGGGAGSFQFTYLEHRRSGESPRDPHSLLVRVASELGLAGLALLIAFVVGCIGAAVRSRRRGPVAAALVAAAVAGGAQWFVQGSYDWFWQYPGVSAPGFYLLGVAAGPAIARRRSVSAGAPARWALAAALAAAALVAAPLFVSDRYTQRGVAEAGSDPAAALRDLGRAADLNPLADQPLIDRGAVAAGVGDRALALSSFREAIDRVPDNYASHWFLARELLRSRPLAARAAPGARQGAEPARPRGAGPLEAPEGGGEVGAAAAMRRAEARPRRGRLARTGGVCQNAADRAPSGRDLRGSIRNERTRPKNRPQGAFRVDRRRRRGPRAARLGLRRLRGFGPDPGAVPDPVTQISHGSGAAGLEKTVVSGLPFTGLDLIAMVAVAVLLASMGLALRRLTVGRDSGT